MYLRKNSQIENQNRNLLNRKWQSSNATTLGGSIRGALALGLGIPPDDQVHRERPLKLREEITNMAENTVDIRTFGDWALLTNEEMQTTLSKTDTKDLAVALKGRGEDIREVEKRTMANISERVQGFVRKIWAESIIFPEDTEASQEKILQIIHGLQTTGKIRPSSENQP